MAKGVRKERLSYPVGIKRARMAIKEPGTMQSTIFSITQIPY